MLNFSHTPTKDGPWLTQHSAQEHSAPCTHGGCATVASAPSDTGTPSGVCMDSMDSAWSQPAFKHCQHHHLVPGFLFGFGFWLGVGVFFYLPWVCTALNYQNYGNMGTTEGLRSN